MMRSLRSWIKGRMRQPPDTSGIDDVTALLQRWREPLVRDQLFARIYPELKRVAGLRMRRERPDHTLQPTALVNEVFLVLVRHDAINCHDRAHFLAIASTAMRRILVDHARNRSAQKRASGLKRVPDDRSEERRVGKECRSRWS